MMPKVSFRRTSKLAAVAIAVAGAGAFAAVPAHAAPGNCDQWGFSGATNIKLSTGPMLSFEAVESSKIDGNFATDARQDNGKISGAISEEERLSKIQSLIKAQPAIARVKETGAQNGENSDFVVLDRGLQANLAAGDKFSVRRGTIVMGTIVIGDTIMENECVANVEKLTEGASVKKGDEIIKWVSR
jgi:hypothetical protein